MSRPVAAVAVCTYNRARVLGDCLASLGALDIDLATVEVIVVDNGSDDDASSVVDGWQEHLPNLRYLRRSSPGLSAARNLALRHSTAEVVAFLDDDARASPRWLGALLAAYADGATVAAGGPVMLEWPAAPPRWMSPEIASWFSELDLGPSPHLLSDREQLVGCNLSVRRETALAVGGFDELLGRIGRRLWSGEDWRMVRQLRTAGDVAYVPDAVVVHQVLPERAHLRWLLRRCYAQGRTNAHSHVLGGQAAPRGTAASAELLGALRRLAGDLSQCVRGAAVRDVVPHVARHAMDAGFARQRLGRSWHERRGAHRSADRSGEPVDR